MSAWLTVVGMGADGPDGLPPAARALIDNAEVLVGGERHLALVDGLAARDRCEMIAWEFPLDATMATIAENHGRRVVVLATGDPMAYGIGSTLARRFDPEDLAIVPAPGAFSLAAARLAWPLDRCVCLTLHGRPIDLLAYHAQPGARLLILSHDGSTPAKVAARLTGLGYGPSRMSVLQNMGAAGEACQDGSAEAWPAAEIADLNTIAVDCIAGATAQVHSHAPGLPDKAFLHDGQLTKRIVRAATLAVLAPLPGQHLWDLGAGSGAVAIEWLRAAQNAQGRGASAVAVERDPARAARIAENASRLGTPFLEIVTDDIAAALPDLAPP
ncbi:MAG: precorrin-6y C5,15-methyltransferase (decarboxylating) subunit CbiE, partial [Alphaproteobacteria bacterium]|nr:precorrin-6y C5,15-methyltransferase (decarboxylating) subunit CbiE [Alphaproteobacteria bacterium]